MILPQLLIYIFQREGENRKVKGKKKGEVVGKNMSYILSKNITEQECNSQESEHQTPERRAAVCVPILTN